jgi:hypothetical protein
MKIHIEKLPSGEVEVDISLTAYESLDIPAAYYSVDGGYICKTDAEAREILAVIAKAGA